MRFSLFLLPLLLSFSLSSFLPSSLPLPPPPPSFSLHLTSSFPLPSSTLLEDPEFLGLTPAEIIAGFDLATKGIKAVTDGFKGIVDAFKTTKTSEVKEVLVGKGFKNFSASAQMNKVVGLQASYFETFKQHLYERIQVPEERKKDLDYVLQDFEYMDEQTWTTYKMAFNTNDGGDCKFVAILANRNSTSQKINMLITDVKAGFKLAPNTMVIKEARSYVGGIYSSDITKYQDVDRSITEDELKAVFNFFTVVVFKSFGDAVGINTDFPPLN